MDLTIHTGRTEPGTYDDMTGFYVRARDPETGKVGSYDIAKLDQPSLRTWLKSLDDPNAHIKIIMALLDHPTTKEN